jgi:hypothetical protein
MVVILPHIQAGTGEDGRVIGLAGLNPIFRGEGGRLVGDAGVLIDTEYVRKTCATGFEGVAGLHFWWRWCGERNRGS